MPRFSLKTLFALQAAVAILLGAYFLAGWRGLDGALMFLAACVLFRGVANPLNQPCLADRELNHDARSNAQATPASTGSIPNDAPRRAPFSVALPHYCIAAALWSAVLLIEWISYTHRQWHWLAWWYDSGYLSPIAFDVLLNSLALLGGGLFPWVALFAWLRFPRSWREAVLALGMVLFMIDLYVLGFYLLHEVIFTW